MGSAGRAAAVTAVAPVLWASSFVVTTELLPPGRPLFSACARVLPAALLLLVLVRRLPSGKWWWRTFILGLTNIGLFFPFQFLAAYRMPGGLASSVQATSPLVIMGLAWLLLREKPGTVRVVAGLSGFAGVLLLVLAAAGTFDLLGVVGAVGALSSIALGSVLLKRWHTDESVLTLLSWQLAAGTLILAPLAFLVEGAPPQLDRSALLGYAWLGLMSTLLAQACWLYGLTRMPAGSAGMIGLLYPVVATILGVLIAHETFALPQLVGMSVVVGSVLAGQPGIARKLRDLARLRLPRRMEKRMACYTTAPVSSATLDDIKDTSQSEADAAA